MTRTIRLLLRVSALVLLACVLVGVPWLVVRTTGWPPIAVDELRTAWGSRHLDERAVLQVGSAVFVALWAWFAGTALAEAAHVLRWRLGRSPRPLLPVAAGPGGWVRGIVRFVAVSSVTAAPALGGFNGLAGLDRPALTAFASDAAPSAVPVGNGRSAHHSAVDRGMAHVVVVGDTYWEIAEDHLADALHREPLPRQVLDYTNELVEFNAQLLGHRDPTLIVPGEVVVLTPIAVPGGEPTVRPIVEAPSPPPAPTPTPVPTPAPAPVATPEVPPIAPAEPAQPVASDVPVAPDVGDALDARVTDPAAERSGPSTATAFAAGVGTALLLSAGAMSVLEARRRRQLRATHVGARLVPPSPTMVQTERSMRCTNASERLARLDLALRGAARDLAAQHAVVTAALIDDDGEVRLYLRGSAIPADPRWRVDLHTGTWRLPAELSLSDLAETASASRQPCPAIVHLGRVPGRSDLFVDLEAIGVLAVQSPHAPDVLRCIAASVAVSPFLEASRVFTVNLGDVSLGAGNSEPLESLDSALDAAAMALGSTPAMSRGTSTFALRATTPEGGEPWEPAIVVAAMSDHHEPMMPAKELDRVGPGAGLGVVVDIPAPSGWTLRYDAGRRDHVLEPLGLHLLPAGLSDDDVSAVTDLLDSARQQPTVDAEVVPIDVHTRLARPFEEAEWALMVSVLGHVGVVAHDGVIADFERSKALELVVWLSQHRERPTRTGARTALWDLDVRDATFANVVSDARRTLSRAIPANEGDEWVARTLTEDLPLHPRVVTDAELLAARVAHARHLPARDAIAVLRPGLELVTGMPFAGTSYLWADAEGITSSLVLLATSAAIQLATHYLAIGDVDGVFWATGQGLKVLSGHEELIALRMRAHAQRGDLAGVRGEWESYERALAADPWAAAEPAAKLVALRRELLSSA